MNAEIIAVGSELLLGQIANTNGQFLSKHLAELGINVYYHTVVGDNGGRLVQAIQVAQNRSNLIILTGGLGPTEDDLTKETIATLLNKALVYDKQALHNMEAFFVKRHKPLDENNKKQAQVIKGSTVFENHHGLAPGMAVKSNETMFILLPGPPIEIEPMVLTDVKPFLREYLSKEVIIYSRVLRFFNIGESEIETKLKDLIEGQTNPTIAPLATEGEVTIRLTAKATNKNKAIEKIQLIEQMILNRVGSYFYGYDDSTLIEQVKNLLLKKKITLAAAESLTGGLFSDQLTNFSGVSSIFNGSVISYSNFVKQHVLGVSKDTIETFGVVSEQCALEMAEQVRKLCQADFGISFTGVAGPTRQEDKDVGTVFIGFSLPNGKSKVYPLQLAGSRQQIRNRTIKYGCFYLLKELKRWN